MELDYSDILKYKINNFDNLCISFMEISCLNNSVYFAIFESFYKAIKKQINKTLACDGKTEVLSENKDKQIILLSGRKEQGGYRPHCIVGYDKNKNAYTGCTIKELISVIDKTGDLALDIKSGLRDYTFRNSVTSYVRKSEQFDKMILLRKDKALISEIYPHDEYVSSWGNLENIIMTLAENYIKFPIKENIYLIMPEEGLNKSNSKIQVLDSTVIPFNDYKPCMIVSFNELTNQIQGLSDIQCQTIIKDLKYYKDLKLINFNLGENNV